MAVALPITAGVRSIILWMSGGEDARDDTDDALMVRIQRDDRDAFSALVRRHARRLQAFAARLTDNADEADDIAQETLLRVWQRAGTWRQGRVQFATWMYRIAHNLCIDAWRRRRGERRVDSTSLDELSNDQSADTLALTDELGRRVATALQALPERQRSALVLCCYSGLSNRQAGEVLGLSDEAVESLLARARRTLRQSLGEDAR